MSQSSEEVCVINRAFKHIVSAFTVCSLLAAMPAVAESQTQSGKLLAIDSIARDSINVSTGLQLARKRASENDLVGALSTLEILMTLHPESDEAILLHASIVCRLDDRIGSMIEFDYLRGSNFSDDSWAKATAPCQPASSADKQEVKP